VEILGFTRFASVVGNDLEGSGRSLIAGTYLFIS
jgi:hypothetical protein